MNEIGLDNYDTVLYCFFFNRKIIISVVPEYCIVIFYFICLHASVQLSLTNYSETVLHYYMSISPLWDLYNLKQL